MKKLSMHGVAAAVAFAFAGTVYAAQDTANPPAGGLTQQQINQEHKAAMERCKPMKGNAEDICKAEADGKKKVAEAELKLQKKDTPENRRDLAEAKAKAKYDVDKERCDDMKGDAKDSCQHQAKADRDRAMAEAKSDKTSSSRGASRKQQ